MCISIRNETSINHGLKWKGSNARRFSETFQNRAFYTDGFEIYFFDIERRLFGLTTSNK